jgi:hypothetical protein
VGGSWIRGYDFLTTSLHPVPNGNYTVYLHIYIRTYVYACTLPHVRECMCIRYTARGVRPCRRNFARSRGSESNTGGATREAKKKITPKAFFDLTIMNRTGTTRVYVYIYILRCIFTSTLPATLIELSLSL